VLPFYRVEQADKGKPEQKPILDPMDIKQGEIWEQTQKAHREGRIPTV